MRIAGNTTCKQTLLASTLDGTNHVRCGTRGSDTYHRIIGGRLIAHQVVPTLLFIVLGMLYSTSQGLVATSNQAYHPIGLYTKSWWQLAGIKHA